MIRSTIFAAAATFALTAPLSAQEAIKIHPKQVTIGVVKNVKLSPLQRKGLSYFRSQKSYFGAFYVSLDGKWFQSFINWHYLEKVKVAVKKACDTRPNGSPCVLAAVSVPEGVPVDAKSATGLGSSARASMQDYRDRQVEGQYGAFAISNSSHEGYSFNWPNSAEARETALEYCRASVAHDMAGIGTEGRKFARAKGYNTCKIIDRYDPA